VIHQRAGRPSRGFRRFSVSESTEKPPYNDAMSIQEQQALDSLYDIGNVLTINIVMPAADWEAVRTEQPQGGVCNFD
jgi:hypothetical protein